jgi:hypothetical protein
MKSIKQTLIAVAIIAAGASALPASAQWAGQYDSDVPYGVITRNPTPVTMQKAMPAASQSGVDSKAELKRDAHSMAHLQMAENTHLNTFFKEFGSGK